MSAKGRAPARGDGAGALASGHALSVFSLLRVRPRASRGVWLAVHPTGRPLATAKTDSACR